MINGKDPTVDTGSGTEFSDAIEYIINISLSWVPTPWFEFFEVWF